MSYLKNYRWLMLLLVAVSLILVPGFTNDAVAKGKGGKPGGKGECVSTDPVMITLQDLDDWINKGLALEAMGKDFSKGYNNGHKDSCGYKKMAILTVQTGGNYAAGHPIGAHIYNQGTELRTFRSDGILSIKRNVATQPMMDVVLQRAGVNKSTVVVLTGRNLQQIGIAYFGLRYWGIPKSRLRVTNGVLRDYPGVMTTDVPVPADSNFSVCDLEWSTGQPSHDEVRASLEEMMNVASDSDPTTIVLDVRSESEYNGTQARTDTAFSGHIKTAVWNEWTNEATNGASGAGTQIKDAATLTAMYNALGITSADTMYVY